MSFMDKSFWVLGSDTEIGKTYVTSLLTLYRQAQGHTVSVCKPVSCGLQEFMNEEVNPDVEALKEIVSGQQPTKEICPWQFTRPMGPWSAAEVDGRTVTAKEVSDWVLGLHQKYGWVAAEGVGGISVPLNKEELFVDAVAMSGLPAILVVGLKLGCINHALLSLEILEKRGVEVEAVVLNQCQTGVSDDVLKSSTREISSRSGKIIELPHKASYPMAMGALEKQLS